MSPSFRPVIETWGEHCPLFMEHEPLLAFFDDLAARAGVAVRSASMARFRQSGLPMEGNSSTTSRTTSGSIRKVFTRVSPSWV